MSNSNTSGAYCTHSPSPVHSSWSIHTRNDSVTSAKHPLQSLRIEPLVVQGSSDPERARVCRVVMRERSAKREVAVVAHDARNGPEGPQRGSRSDAGDAEL